MLKFFRKKTPVPVGAPPMSIGEGRRVYAVGDIHGRLDLFEQLLGMIDADDARRAGTARTELILLGDLIDRGPHSAQIMERAIALKQSGAAVRILMGNHEEVFLRSLAREDGALRFFCRIGGKETLLSYGLSIEDYNRMDYPELADWLAQAVPPSHVAFLQEMEDIITIGDYCFVHAGVRPERPLSEQKAADLHWIREDFLNWREPHEKLIIHGHTITDGVDERCNRIGIDTGAFQSGALTAIGLEGTDRWFLATAQDEELAA